MTFYSTGLGEVLTAEPEKAQLVEMEDLQLFAAGVVQRFEQFGQALAAAFNSMVDGFLAAMEPFMPYLAPIALYQRRLEVSERAGWNDPAARWDMWSRKSTLTKTKRMEKIRGRSVRSDDE